MKRNLISIIALVFLVFLISTTQATDETGLSGLNEPRSVTDSKEINIAADGDLVVTCLGSTPSDIVDALLGSGIIASNITYQGTACSAGTFGNGIDPVGIEEGIILSNGVIQNVIGPNVNDEISVDNSLPGDAALSGLIGQTTFDATILEFDFVPASDVLTFRYVFASDEYNEYVGQYNDVFGFFLNGQDASDNIAVIPGTTTYVSINNVNKNTYSEFYRNNDLTDGPATINTEMDGLTTVFIATAYVEKGEKNHIKLAIADASDRFLDSDVFITNFQSPLITLTPFAATNDLGEEHELSATIVDPTGTPIPGIETHFEVTGANIATGTATSNDEGIAIWSYVGTNEGTDTITASAVVDLQELISNTVSKTWVNLNEYPVSDPNGPYSGLVGQVINFDGSGSYDPDGTITLYEWDFNNDGVFDVSHPTSSATHTYSTFGTFTVTLRVTDNQSATATATTTATINAPPVAEANGPYSGSINQLITFSSAGSYDPDGSIVTYDWNWGDGTAHGSGQSPTHAYTTAGTKTVILTVTDNLGATGTDTATVKILTVCESIQELKNTVKSMTLSPTIRTALNTRLDKALKLCKQGPIKYPAIATLFKNDFIPYVNTKTGKGITPAQATTLIEQANIIIAACGK